MVFYSARLHSYSIIENSRDGVTRSARIEFPNPDPLTLIDNGTLRLAGGWGRNRTPAATYWSGQRDGVNARFGSGTTTIDVLPGQIERRRNLKTV